MDMINFEKIKWITNQNSYKADQIIRNHMLWVDGSGIDMGTLLLIFWLFRPYSWTWSDNWQLFMAKTSKSTKQKLISALGSSGVNRIAARVVKFILE